MTLRLFGRAMRRRCPNCGERGLFRRWLVMEEDCPRCGLHFERQEGYWLGAIAINTGVTIVVFSLVFVGGMVAFWPDVPWTALTIAVVAVNLVVPVVCYPWSKTLWVAADLAAHSEARSIPRDDPGAIPRSPPGGS